MDNDNIVDRFHCEVKAALVECDLVGGNTLVVAVSGGPDSLAMFFALLHLSTRMGLKLHGAHLNHGLRGDAATADADFVGETFRRVGVALTSESADVASYRETHRLSLEEAARDVRYTFLGRVAQRQRADAVALGHTSDDQAETVLMHIIRGSGLTGLRGMGVSSWRSLAGTEVRLVRPLLRLSRKDTTAYCRALGLEPRIDESNRSLNLTRNRVRAELLPLLEQLNPAVKDALSRLSRAATREVSYLDTALDDVWRDAVRQDGDRIYIDRRAVNGIAPALRTHLLRRAIAAVKGDREGVQQGHLDDMMRLMEGPAGRVAHLPAGLRFHVGYADAVLAHADADLCPLPPLDGEHELGVPGETRVGAWNVTARVAEQGPGNITGARPPTGREHSSPPGPSRAQPVAIDGASAPIEPEPSPPHTPSSPDSSGRIEGRTAIELTARLSYRALDSGLSIRSRRPGDRVQPLGMAGHKKLKDFMVDAKIPRSWRDRVPLLVSPRGIAWVAGWRIANWARVTEDDPQVLEVSLRNLALGKGDDSR